MAVRGRSNMACQVALPTYPMSLVIYGNFGLFTRQDYGFDLKFNVRPEYGTITIEQLVSALIQGYGDRLDRLVSVQAIDHPNYAYCAHLILKEDGVLNGK